MSAAHKQYWIVTVGAEARLTGVRIEGPPRPAITAAAGFSHAEVQAATQIPAGKARGPAEKLFAETQAALLAKLPEQKPTQVLLWVEWTPDEELQSGGRFADAALARSPYRIWTLPGETDKAKPPALPIALAHGKDAFLEDKIHDWAWQAGKLKYFSRVSDRSVWLLLEYAPPAYSVGDAVTAFDAAAEAMGGEPWQPATVVCLLWEDDAWWVNVRFAGGRSSLLDPVGVKPVPKPTKPAKKGGKYPTWERDGPGKWRSAEGRPDSRGNWVPDFVLQRDQRNGVWLGKMRTSAQWSRFESAAAGKTHYERTTVASVASRAKKKPT